MLFRLYYGDSWPVLVLGVILVLLWITVSYTFVVLVTVIDLNLMSLMNTRIVYFPSNTQ